MSNAREGQDILVSEIFSDDEFNCRGVISSFEVQDLAMDIARNTLLSSIVVQPIEDVGKQMPEGKLYRIIAGHRRFKAWTVLQKSWSPGEPSEGGQPPPEDGSNPYDRIPCLIRRGLSEIKARVLNLGENLKRQDLNILQEARAIEHLRLAGVPRDHVAQELGISSGWVQTRYYLLDLPDDVQKECAAGLINQLQIKQLHSLKNDPDRLYSAVRDIKTAKSKGEKLGHVGDRKKAKLDVKKERKRAEIFELIEVLAKTKLGMGIHTRCLAWSSGQITTEELFADVIKWHDEHNHPRPRLPTEL